MAKKERRKPIAGEALSGKKNFIKISFRFCYLLVLCRAALSVCDRTLDRRKAADTIVPFSLGNALVKVICVYLIL
ncbi:hypothetical protein [Dubosiella newyorkensis]|uniref:hypothetical protein n=1 Tax=Dubosiella newyorkensis TaxID=1862672 RepID=UPI003F674995